MSRFKLTGDVKRCVLLASILGSGIVFLDGTVVNVALPAIRAGLHGNLADQQWVVEAYGLTLSSLLLIGGSLGDLRGRRRIMTEGLAAFGVCSLLCAIAPSSTFLIVARGAQGIAGALLVPSSLALIMDNFAEGPDRGGAIGSWTAWTGIATVIGPLGGGWLIQVASWRWIFAINLLPVVVCLELLRRIPESPRVGSRIDIPGGALAAFGLAGPVFALIEEPTYGWGNALVAVPLIVGLVLLVSLILWERRAPEPMLPLSLFRARNFAIGNLTTFALYGGLSIATFFIVLFIQEVGGYTPFKAGLALLPITVIMFTFSRRFGALATRVGPRLFMGFGPIIAGLGLLLESRINSSATYLTHVLPGLAVFAFGLSMTVAPLTATVLGAVPTGHSGVASAVNNAISRVAGLIAIAALGAVIASSFQSRLTQDVAKRHLGGPAAQTAIARARTQPLVTKDSYAPPADRAELHAALVNASVGAFRLGMEISALLAILGGLASLLGIEPLTIPDRKESETAAPETGHRSARGACLPVVQATAPPR